MKFRVRTNSLIRRLVWVFSFSLAFTSFDRPHRCRWWNVNKISVSLIKSFRSFSSLIGIRQDVNEWRRISLRRSFNRKFVYSLNTPPKTSRFWDDANLQRNPFVCRSRVIKLFFCALCTCFCLYYLFASFVHDLLSERWMDWWWFYE